MLDFPCLHLCAARSIHGRGREGRNGRGELQVDCAYLLTCNNHPHTDSRDSTVEYCRALNLILCTCARRHSLTALRSASMEASLRVSRRCSRSLIWSCPITSRRMSTDQTCRIMYQGTTRSQSQKHRFSSDPRSTKARHHASFGC